ncbi:ABC transporter ATP-binding protein [Anaerosphaera multitolerans]|uniref:ABC transporter ATP-binding protein n=1 Tax=Anaerosphaera multitolerans TaxID=2487351 RepID=A0A437S5Y0_9FIRM|nr:ABC transporter ATP-binding protein [Anaerosphaera multitolerans]RVU54420.1 ABC transporter ATP-binding protein [Anaerosphaera multitolerans]
MEIKHLNFSYGKSKVLKDINVKFKEGSITTIIGSNGSGKSTLLNLCTKNLVTRQGKITLKGKNIKDIKYKEFAQQVAIVHQQNRIRGDITVEQFVSYGRTPYLKPLRRYTEKDYEEVEWALELTKLLDFKNEEIEKLSGGQKQRVFIAMALAQKSNILFLDEPTTYLDIKYQFDILNLIKKLNKNLGITIIMVLHDINQAINYSDEVVGMLDGKIKFKGSPNRVLDNENLSEIYDISLKVEEVCGNKVVLQDQ